LFFSPKLGRGLSDFDVRQNLTVNYIWQVPGSKSSSGLVRAAGSGWQWGGILHVSGGVPFTPLVGGDPLGMENATSFDFPDRLAGSGCRGSLVNPGNPTQYIKTQCFAFQTPATSMGNSGRNILIGPGLSNFDMSLFKNIRVSDRFKAQFRAELFNIFNHPNFAPPTSANSTVFNQSGNPISSAGLLTSTVTTSRQVQFGLKLLW
jgi:hypothetical protein